MYIINNNVPLLGATKHLYNWLCPSVGWSVTHSFDDPHVAPYWPTWPCLSCLPWICAEAISLHSPRLPFSPAFEGIFGSRRRCSCVERWVCPRLSQPRWICRACRGFPSWRRCVPREMSRKRPNHEEDRPMTCVWKELRGWERINTSENKIIWKQRWYILKAYMNADNSVKFRIL